MAEIAYYIPKMAAIEYTGSNSQEVIDAAAALNPGTSFSVESEVDGVLTITPGAPPNGTTSVNAGDFLLFTPFPLGSTDAQSLANGSFQIHPKVLEV